MQNKLTLTRSTVDGGAPASSLRLAASVLPAVFPLLVAAIGVGLWRSLTSLTTVSTPEQLAAWFAIIVPLVLWLVAVWAFARAGVYARPLAVQVGVVLPPVIGLALISRLPLLPQLLAVTPPAWLIASMVVRLAGGIFLIAAASGELRRPWFNVSAGSLDILIGVTAIPIAVWVSSGSPVAVPVGIVWNAVGLFDFALAIVLARYGSGPRDMLLQETPVVRALKPTIMGIVTFGVPLAIIIHVLSLWMLIAD